MACPAGIIWSRGNRRPPRSDRAGGGQIGQEQEESAERGLKPAGGEIQAAHIGHGELSRGGPSGPAMK